ncbi:MAG: hypothetical protein EOP88_05910 [Verrucomicrobiaceae bacterium]|nr:MAG: hypothetical protein EOP88_05910 [Verrucomicrobiaceae bacterium]
MKYRPSKWFLRIVIPAALLAAVVWFGVLPEVEDAWAEPVKGEIVFKEKGGPLERTGGYQVKSVLPPMLRLKEWLGSSMEDLMRWEHNPWKLAGDRPHPASHFLDMLASKDPKEQAKAREIQRLAEEWLKKLMERYPELAVTPHPVPDERNGFLQWLDFSARLKQQVGPHEAASMGLTKPLTDYLAGNAPWDAAAAREWLAANAALMKEVHALAALEESSTEGIPVDRYFFVQARLAKEATDALMLEARVAAENGDVAAAMESMAAVRGLVDIFTEVESPTLLMGTVSILVRLNLEKRFFSDILPALPPGSQDIAAWEALVNPQVDPPAEYARLMRGEWSMAVRQWILPPILDPENPLPVPDGGELIEVFSLPYREISLAYGDARWSDAPPVLSDPDAAATGLSRNSQSMVPNLMGSTEAWRKGMLQSQYTHGLNQAAFSILKGQPLPVDPVWGKPYRWDPSTRTLSMPTGPEFDGLKIDPLVVPRR